VNFVAGGWDQASIETTDEPIGEGDWLKQHNDQRDFGG
jgi:hypothetical protein